MPIALPLSPPNVSEKCAIATGCIERRVDLIRLDARLL
jgi:hypothetical protein